jgi:hypothetical protein
MSLTPFEPGDVETFTIQTTPSTTFVSSSAGVTGSVYVYTRRSNAVKDYYVNWSAVSGAPTGSFHQINDIDDVLEYAKLSTTPTQLHDRVSQYLDVVKSQPQSVRNSQYQEVVRFTPGYNLDLDMTRKFIVSNVLMPTYHVFGTSYNFAYTNYHSLNFFVDKELPSNSALIYPTTGSATNLGQVISASYIPSGAFSFDFWINPRYTNDNPVQPVYKPGTIFHLSGGYALSLVTGSSKDTNGYANGYRLLLQLSNSSDTPPSMVDPNALTGLTFLSNDNALTRNAWQHVTIRWGTESYNFGSGSFIVDEVEQGTFYVPSASVAPRLTSTSDMPCCLVVGNYLEQPSSNTSRYFFSKAATIRFGVPVNGYALDTSTTLDEPPSYTMDHPLKAEVHELKIYNKFLPDSEVLSRSLTGASLSENLLFYVPPFFTKESPTRSVDTNGIGGVMAHPLTMVNGTTEQPFNTLLSFDTGGHYINLENHTRDFCNGGNYPRIIKLTGSALPGMSEQISCNEFLYHTSSVKKGSLTVLPNDNGYFTPNYFELLSPLNTDSFKTDKGQTAYNLVSLRNMFSLNEIYDLAGVPYGSGLLNTNNNLQILDSLSGYTSTSSFGTLNPQRAPTILQRTRENNSLQVVLFDVSSLFYGDKISPGTLTLTDNNVANSYGKVGITLKDDGAGNLYRANSDGTLAVNNSVGNVFYDHGLVLIKNPSLYFFGENEFSCSFKGERNIHVQKMDLYANALELVSSSNPSWSPSLQASNNIDDYDKRYVYITDLYIHDDNLNVIAKTKLAQPLLKSSGDKFKFTIKYDY